MVMDLHAYARIMTGREPDLWRHVGHHRTASGIRRRRVASPAPAPDGRTRVLVENPDAGVRSVMAQVLEREGYLVETCAGPSGSEPCPALAGRVCPRAARADVIVAGLGLGRVESRSIVQALHELHPRTPILVDAPAPQVATHAAAVAGCEVLDFPCTRDSLVAAVRAQTG